MQSTCTTSRTWRPSPSDSNEYRRIKNAAKELERKALGLCRQCPEHMSALRLVSGMDTNIVSGIDVSLVQTVDSYQKIRDAGYRFLIAKATESEHYVDPKMVTHINGANSVGMLTGVYAFALPDESPDDDVDGLMNSIKPLEARQPLDFPATLDIESRNNRTPKQILVWARRWCELYQQRDRLNRRPLIYTSIGYWNLLVDEEPELATDPFWLEHILWVAHYTSAQKPLIPSPWSRQGWGQPRGARIWQWAASDPRGPLGKVPGIHGLVDLDRFAGCYDDLRTLMGLEVATSTLAG